MKIIKNKAVDIGQGANTRHAPHVRRRCTNQNIENFNRGIVYVQFIVGASAFIVTRDCLNFA